MNRGLLVDFAELSHLSISCTKCKTRVLIDCSDVEANIPSQCPSCTVLYDEAFRTALHQYRTVYRKLSDPNARHVQVAIASTD